MQQRIEQILKKHVEVYGFVPITSYLEQRRLLDKFDGFNDASNFKGYQTIITLGIPYPSKPTPWLGKGYGILSRYSYGTDYHLVFKSILKKIAKELNQCGIKTHASVDTSFVDERYAAFLSGIGFLGKNQFLIHPTYGSYLYLATILVDVSLDKIHVNIDSCMDCRICIDHCPSHALDDGYDVSKCISYLSQEKKELNETEISYFKTMIYGCDICQKVCPKNKGIDVHHYQAFEPSGIENINIEDLLSMTNKTYLHLYGQNASSWKGATILKRNALCLIANQKLYTLLPRVKEIVRVSNVSWLKDTAKNVVNILETGIKDTE